MDVFAPKENSNHAAVVLVMSGGWVSRKIRFNLIFVLDLVKRGYTVFAVVHGSQPKFTIPECVADLHRAVRGYIRTNAEEFQIDPNRIGISGAFGRRPPVADDRGRGGNRQSQGQGPGRSRGRAGFRPWPASFRRPISELRQDGREGLGPSRTISCKTPFDFHEQEAGQSCQAGQH